MVINANATDMMGFWHWFWQIVLSTFTKEDYRMIKGFLILSVVILIFGKGIERKYFGIQSVLIVGIVFNPYSMYYLCKWFGLSSRYFRYLWITPLMLVYGYAVVKVVLFKENKVTKVLAYVVSAVFLVYGAYEMVQGTYYIRPSFHQPAGMVAVDNVYKVEQDTIDVVEVIERDKGGPDCAVKVLYGYEMFIDIRTYDASICSGFSKYDQNRYVGSPFNYDVIQDLYEKEDYFNLLNYMVNAYNQDDRYAKMSWDKQTLRDILEQQGYEYVIVRTNASCRNMFVDCGELIGKTEHFTVVAVR